VRERLRFRRDFRPDLTRDLVAVQNGSRHRSSSRNEFWRDSF
jgi:hypothetical protein